MEHLKTLSEWLNGEVNQGNISRELEMRILLAQAEQLERIASLLEEKK